MVPRTSQVFAEPDWSSGTRVARSFTYDPVGDFLQEDVERDGSGIKEVVPSYSYSSHWDRWRPAGGRFSVRSSSPTGTDDKKKRRGR